MKKLLTVFTLASLLPVLSSPGALDINFNNLGDFTANFSTGQSNPIGEAASGGINNTRAVDLTPLGGNTTQFWTLNQSFSGDLASWEASMFFQGNAQSGMWQFGFMQEEAPGEAFGYASTDGGSTYVPTMFTQTGNADNGSIAVGNLASPTGSVQWGTVVETVPDLPSSNQWWKYDFSVTYLGSGQYSVQSSITAANADGSLGSVYGTTNDTFTNSALAGDSDVYLYFSVYDGVRLDNFSTTAVPEPAAMGALSGLLALLFVAAFRRRSNR